MFPCASCGAARSDIEAACQKCGWKPEPVTSAMPRVENISKTKKHYSDPRKIFGGAISILFGGALCLGAIGWLVANIILLGMQLTPLSLSLGILQLFAGIGFAIAGIFCLANIKAAIHTLAISIVCVLIVMGLAPFAMFSFIESLKNRQLDAKLLIVAEDLDRLP